MNSVHGTIEIGDEEHTWKFTPLQPWPAEELHLVADPALEDVAGNNFHDLLDHIAGSQSSNTPSTQLPIRIRECAG